MLVLAVCLAVWPSGAAETKKWEMFTNCQFVARAANDGDSFRVRSGSNDFLVRLYFVDAPETDLRYPERTREQSDYFGVTLDETMKAGRAAKELTRDTLREPFTVWTRWSGGGGRSSEPRYYSFVRVGTNNLDEILVSRGLARARGMRVTLPTGEKAAAHLEKLQALEADARKRKAGLWENSTGKKEDKNTP